VSSITSAPRSCGAVAGPSRNSWTRRSLTCWWSQADSERNHCSRWTSRCWAPATGSAPANPVRAAGEVGGDLLDAGRVDHDLQPPGQHALVASERGGGRGLGEVAGGEDYGIAPQ